MDFMKHEIFMEGTMKRVWWILLVVCIAMSGQIAFAGAKAEAKSTAELKPMTLRYGISSAPGSVLEQKGRFFAQKVAEKTGGKLTIGVYPSGQLGTMQERLQGISMGTVDMGAEAEMFMDSVLKDYGILSTPFLFSREELKTLPLINELREQARQKSGIRTLPGIGFRPPFHLFTKGRQVNNPGELQGMKVRVWGGAVVHVWNGLGATGVMTNWGDTYLAVSQGIVDAVFHSTTTIYEGKLHELLSNCMMIDALALTDATWINDGLFNKLPPEYQKALEAASIESADWQTENYTKADAEAIKIVESKVKFIKVDRSAWEAKSKEVARKLEKDGLWSAGLLKKLGKE
jgi:TRAP-type C4-dicarboxylate transport system substrate-binding protein